MALGFDEVVLDLLETDTPPRVSPFAGYWLDIGRPDDYDTANDEWPSLRRKLLADDR
jgi:mannose-1-phosphate guanylyltransferase